MLVVLDEFTRRCLAIVVARRRRFDDVCFTIWPTSLSPTDRLNTFFRQRPRVIAINVR